MIELFHLKKVGGGFGNGLVVAVYAGMTDFGLLGRLGVDEYRRLTSKARNSLDDVRGGGTDDYPIRLPFLELLQLLPRSAFTIKPDMDIWMCGRILENATGHLP